MSLNKDLNTLKRVQIYPATERVECNDKMTKITFSHDYENFNRLIEGKSGGIIEKKKRSKKGKERIITSYTVQNADGFGNKEPLDEFDRAIFGVMVSEFLKGNQYTTPSIIFRALIGKVGEGYNGINPTKNQVTMIETSIDKMMFTEFDSNAAQSLEQMKYDNGEEIFIEKSAILPCYRVKAIIGGTVVKAIFFDRESPLWIIANAKNQVLRYDVSLLYTGDHYNTRHKIAVVHYVMRRVMEIVKHKNLTPVITFADVFKKCGVENVSRKVKSVLRDNIFKLLDNLKSAKIISGYLINQQGSAYISLKLLR